MKKQILKIKRLFTLTILLFPIISSAQNPHITDIINHISADSIRRNVEDLENFTTRFAFADNNKDVALYLKDRMEYYGFEVILDSFYEENCAVWKDNLFFQGWQYNVCCLKKSDIPLQKDSSLILGAHYDCISNIDDFKDYLHFAPGADDNASGVACLLELARVWNKTQVNHKYNLRIEFFANEEQTLAGSNARMHSISKTHNVGILAMVNLDMVGFDSTNTVCLNYYDNSEWLTELAKNNTSLYTDLNLNLSQEFIERSDSWCFYSWGVTSLFITENDFSPYYHSLQDSSVYLNYPYMKKITALTLSIAYDILNNYPKVDINQPIIPIVSFIYDNNSLNLTFATAQDKIITLTDTFGRIIYKKNTKNQSITIPINHLKNSMYILSITTSNSKITRKFIK